MKLFKLMMCLQPTSRWARKKIGGRFITLNLYREMTVTALCRSIDAESRSAKACFCTPLVLQSFKEESYAKFYVLESDENRL